MGFGKKFSQNPILLYFCIKELNFAIFVRARVIMTSQKPNPGDIVLNLVMVRGYSKLTISAKINIIQEFILKIRRGW